MNKDEIYNAYPLLTPGGTEHCLVIGDDLDSYLSAMLFIKYHPATTIIGFYEQYQTLHIVSDYKELLSRTLWIDLDIYHPQCNSLGHHIVRTTKNDVLQGFHNSCNLNELRRIDCGRFKRKYPLGTIHFLISLYNESYLPGSDAELLFWLADSSYINGQRHRFRNNVREWIDDFLDHKQLRSTFETIDTARFENRMEGLYEELMATGFRQGHGQITSHHLKLSGFQLQCQFKDKSYFRKVCSFLSKKLQLPHLMDTMNMEKINKKIDGERNNESVDLVLRDGTIDSFLSEKHVFSYVFSHRDMINYTTSMDV